MHVLGLDIGSNSVGSAWIDRGTGRITAGVSVFPAGVEESDEKRGDPKNAARRMTRRTRITLGRRAQRKRALRLKLIEVGLLPGSEQEFRRLLESTDPWEPRSRGLSEHLHPFEFGRVLLHLSQRRGALGLHVTDAEGDEAPNEAKDDDGKVKASVQRVNKEMHHRDAETFGQLMHTLRSERVTPITTEDKRRAGRRIGRREWRGAIRNKAASYEHCADRSMIRHEFDLLWRRQSQAGGTTARLLTPSLRQLLDDESGDAIWRHKGLLFGQRRQSWDLGTLGRCDLHPEDRCIAHADMYASRYLVVETVNNLKVIERGKEARPLTCEERERIKAYLSGPLGADRGRKKLGDSASPAQRPKRTVSVADLRNLLGSTKDGWGRASRTARFRFNIESDEDRTINTDWFSRDIIHEAITPVDRCEPRGCAACQAWLSLPLRIRDGLNRAILKYDPDQEDDARKLHAGATSWAALTNSQAEALVRAWRSRPRPDAKRLSMSRRAVRNLLTVMDRAEPWPDPNRPGQHRWLTQIEARKLLAGDADFADATTGRPLDDATRRRYATGAKGATARDRYYMGKHVLMKDGKPVIDAQTGEPLGEPPPAPLLTNPVVRKAIHEVRRHLVEYMMTFGRRPDEVYVELAREARMGKQAADKLLFRNRLRNRIRKSIVQELDLESLSSTQQRAAIDRVVLCVQQGCRCPLCGEAGLTPRQAARGENCELAHIVPRGGGGHNGFSNIVLAHTKCNRDMDRRTPRQFWSEGTGFDQGMVWVEGIYGEVSRPKGSEIRSASGDALWAAYFTKRDDNAKLEQFKKNIADIQGMTERQEAATKYATRQVMAYIADALYDGKGLPERSLPAGGEDARRRIFATDGLWTSRVRREWELFFDPHGVRSHSLQRDEGRLRKEKDRGDHRHHVIDAVTIALCTRQVQRAWEDREKRADSEKVNTADHAALEEYRRRYPIAPPEPFKSTDELRAAVKQAVFEDGNGPRPVCHRPVKRKLVGALHEATLLGPVVNGAGELTDRYTARKSVFQLEPKHLRLPRPETEAEAIARLTVERRRSEKSAKQTARKWASEFVRSPAYRAAMVEPAPEKSGIVRDLSLRRRLRDCIEGAGLDPDRFSKAQLKKLVDDGGMRQRSGVAIRSAVLLRTMKDPVVIRRRYPDYRTGRMLVEESLESRRAYQGGNNHHIEIRVDERGHWKGEIVTAFEAAQRKLARLRSLREAGIPPPRKFRALPRQERRRLAPVLSSIEASNPVVDRGDSDSKGGRFVMSLCEGEMLWMLHKETGEFGYFVVAKLERPQNCLVLVPHWDARAATPRKDADGNPVEGSKREQFTISASDLKMLAPPGRDHAEKVRVSPLGRVTILSKD
jgi:CRISPR-associated endonuclease Csn1